MPTRKSFPLQWPDGWKRARSRGTPAFATEFTRDRDAVLRYLQYRNGANIVITSNLPTRGDGLPYEAGVHNGDPGVAVWWVERGREMVMACDAWTRAAQNLRAVELSLKALRGLDRWGCTNIVERAFAGFLALPPGTPAVVRREWHEVLNMSDMYKSGVMSDADLLIIAKARHRDLMKVSHPDHGGNDALASELNDALATAESEMS